MNPFDQFKTTPSSNPFDQFEAAPAPSPLTRPPRRTGAEIAKDTAVGIAQGAVNLGGGLATLPDLATGGALSEYVVKPLQRGASIALGGNGEDSGGLSRGLTRVNEGLNELKSSVLQQKTQELADTEGFFASAKKVLTEPALLGQFVAEQVPVLATLGLGTAGTAAKAAQGLQGAAAAKAGQAAATRALTVSQPVMSGGFAAQQAQERGLAIDQATLDANPEYQALIASGATPEAAREQLARKAGAAAIPLAAGTSLLASRLTAPLEAQIFTRSLARAPGVSIPGQIAQGVVREGAQEGIEEGGEQFASNFGVQQFVDPNQSLTEGVAESAGAAAAAGGAIGGATVGAGMALSRPPAAPAAPAGPLSRAAATIQPTPTVAPAPTTAPPQPTAAAQEPQQATGMPFEQLYNAAVQTVFEARKVPSPGKLAQQLNVDRDTAVRLLRSMETNLVVSKPDKGGKARRLLVDPTTGELLPEAAQQAAKREEKAARRSQEQALEAEVRGQPQQAPAPAPTGALGRAAEAATVSGAAQAAAEQQAKSQEAEQQQQQFAEQQRAEDDQKKAVAEQRKEMREQVKDQRMLASVADDDDIKAVVRSEIEQRGRVNVLALAKSLGVKPRQVESIRAEIVRASRAPAIADEPIDAEFTDVTASAAPALPAPDPRPAQMRAVEQADALLPQAQSAPVATAQPAPTEAAFEPSQPTTATTPASESTDVLDDDITLPSGEPFTIRAAAETQAKRTPGSRVVEVDGGYVVRVAPATVQTSETVASVVKDSLTAAPEIESGANQAATSPLNDLPEPTPAQKEAGNYKVGRVKVHGLDISVENPAGSERKGIDKDGKPWSVKMQAHYGYIRRTEGKDGDHVDVFLGPEADNAERQVFVIDQVDPETGKFDEHKVMMGYADEASARAGYMANYTSDWKGLGNITPMSVDAFKTWVREGNTKKPAAVAKVTSDAAPGGARTEVASPVESTPAPLSETKAPPPSGAMQRQRIQRADAVAEVQRQLGVTKRRATEIVNEIRSEAKNLDGVTYNLKPGIVQTADVQAAIERERAQDTQSSSAQTEPAAPEPNSEQAQTNDRDSFTLQRLNPESDQMEPVTFERGEYVRVSLIGSDNSYNGEIDGISQARREFSVNGLWHPFGAAYKADRPAEPKKDTAPLSKVIDKVNAKSGANLGPADAVSPLEAIKGVMTAIYDGTASVDDYRAGYKRARDEQAVKADLGKLTKEDLIRTFGIMARPGEKKDSLVATAYRSVLRGFALGKEFGPRAYMMTRGGLENYEKQKAEALDAIVENHTAEDLAAYAAEVKASREERAANREALIESVKEPKTLDDFRNHERLKMSEGLTSEQARMSLTPEQRAMRDELAAEFSRSKRTSAKDEQRAAVRVAGQTVNGEIIATKHTKKGHDLFVVQLAERVSRDDYETLNAGAKKIGGYYSSFRGGGAIPGFQFATREQAQAFVALAGGDASAAKEAAQERRDAYADDRSQSAAERLVEMAERMEADADESLGRDRKENTERRARFAAAAEAAARQAKAMSKTMRNVAAAITSGKTKFLDRIRTKSQVELLQTYVANAKSDQLRAKYPSYAEQQKRNGEPPDAETADFAQYPEFTAYRSDLASLGRQLQEVDGTKKLGDRLMKVADDVSEAFTAWAKEPGNLLRLSTFSVRAGDEVKTATFRDRETAERAIKRSGLSGKAIVFPEKRGVNRIVMSPSEAIAKGIWQGDGDKRITLSDGFGAELVESIGRAAQRGAKVSVPWQFERAHERRKQLSRMGIETPAEFRAALREFIGLREQAAEADRLKMLERAMIGKAKDGLDFFPTPASVADEMITAAEIKPGMAVLEPSAGMGHIADRIRAAGAEPEVVEMAQDRRELLREKGYYLQPYEDFLQMEPRKFFTFGDVMRAPDGTEGIMHGGPGWSGRASLHAINEDGTEGRMLGWYDRDELVGVRHRGLRGNDAGGYDRIVMNPPFSDGRDTQHVRHAYSLLKPGGRIVALMGESAFTSQNKRATEFREWLESVGGTEEKLPEGSFMDPSLPVSTGVNARMVVIDKSEQSAPASFAKSGEPTGAQRQVIAAWRKLAGTDGLFQFRRSEAKSIADIAKDVAPEFKLTTSGDDGMILFKVPPQRDENGKPKGSERDAIIGIDRKAGTVFVDVADLQEGVHRGGAMYAIALNFAHNNGLVFVPDPEGVKPAAMVRRTEHMLSSALKMGTTRHMRPHPQQNIEWREGDDEHNLVALLQASADNVLRNVPDLASVDYDWDTGRFIDTETNEPVSADAFKVSAAGAESRAAFAGPSTLRRAVVQRSLARRAGTKAWAGVVRSLLRLGRDGVRGSGLEGIAYGRGAANRGTDPAKLRALFRGSIPRLKNLHGIDLQVLDSADALPQSIRDQDDYDDTVQAAISGDRRTVYLIADRISTPRAALKLAAHELVGHFAMEKMLGEQLFGDLQRRIKALADAGKWPEVFAEVRRRYERNADGTFRPLDDATFASETIAVFAEQNIRTSILQRAINAVRGWLRTLFPQLDLSQGELRQMLWEAGRYLEGRAYRPEVVTRALGPSRQSGALRQSPVFGRTSERETFYSALLRAIEEGKGLPKATGATQWKQWLDGAQRRGEIKQSERDWIGVDAWLDSQQSSISREALADFVRANRVDVQEVALGGNGGSALVWEDVRNADLPDGFVSGQESAFNTPRGEEKVGIFEDENGSWWVYHDGNEVAEGLTRERAEQKANQRAGVLQVAEGGVTKYDSYRAPGGKNYRELLLTLPKRSDDEARKNEIQRRAKLREEIEEAELNAIVSARRRIDQENIKAQEAYWERREKHITWRLDQSIKGIADGFARREGGKSTDYIEKARDVVAKDGRYNKFAEDFDRDNNPPELIKYPAITDIISTELRNKRRALMTELEKPLPVSNNYRSSHWDQPNVLAHVRFDERTDADGKRVLFVNEIQSDWHQEGRKKGYAGLTASEQARRATLDEKPMQQWSADDIDWYNTRVNDAQRYGVPDAPLKATDEWAMLAFKRMARYAVDNGFDRISWVTGEQAADMFDLSKQVDEVHVVWARDTYMVEAWRGREKVIEKEAKDEAALADLIGKELAERAANAIDKNGATREDRSATLSGDGLKVGGAGMRGFYDKILPAAVGKWAKKFGAKVERNTVDINPQMRDAVLEGQPLFAKDTPQDIVDRVGAMFSAKNTSLLTRLKDKAEDLRPAALAALQLSHLGELGGEQVPAIGKYARTVQAMNTFRFEQQELGTELLNRHLEYQKKHRDEAKVLHSMLHDATLAGVDPSKAHEPLLMTDAHYKGLVPVTEENVKAFRKTMRQQAKLMPGDASRYIDRMNKASKMLAQERKRRASYAEMVTQWGALSDEAKALWVEIRDAYVAQSKAYSDALQERIQSMDLDERKKAKMLAQIRFEFEAARVPFYVPLARWGTYWVAGTSPAGKREFYMQESAADQREVREQLEAKGFTNIGAGARIEDAKASDGATASFMADIDKLLRSANMPDKVRDEVYQLYLRTLPEMSVRRNFIHRKGTPGYSEDAVRALASHIFHGSYQIARLKYSHHLERHIGDATKMAKDLAAAGEPDANRAANLVNELKKRHEWVMHPQDSTWANVASTVGFIWYLGISPAAALVNLLQTPMVAFPVLGAKYGFDKASAALTKATWQAARTIGNMDRVIQGDELAAYNEMKKRGTFDKTQTQMLAGLSETDTTKYNPLFSKVMNAVSAFFHRAEVINREATAIAAYRLAIADGKGHDAAIDAADAAVNESHFNYENANRARFMQGNWAKVLLQFKQYSLATTWLLGRTAWKAVKGLSPAERSEARRKLAGIMGMAGVFAGVLGMPMVSTVGSVLNAIAAAFGDDDEPWDWETEFRAFMRETIGPDAAEWVLRGPVQGATGLAIAQRVGYGELWFRSPDRELEGQALAHYWLEQLAGPVLGGMTVNAFRGWQLIEQGHMWRGIETMVPKFIKDTMKSVRYTTEGVNSLRGDPIVEDLGAYGTLAQIAGFTPAEVSKIYDVRGDVSKYSDRIAARRRHLMDAFALAIRLGDEGDRNRVLEKIKGFNESYPELAITSATIRRSLMQRARASAMAENGLIISPRLRAVAEQQVGAAP